MSSTLYMQKGKVTYLYTYIVICIYYFKRLINTTYAVIYRPRPNFFPPCAAVRAYFEELLNSIYYLVSGPTSTEHIAIVSHNENLTSVGRARTTPSKNGLLWGVRSPQTKMRNARLITIISLCEFIYIRNLGV